MEQRKCENADDTKQIADDTKQIEDDTKQNKRRQSSWDPNSVGLGLGYFERAKLSHSLLGLSRSKIYVCNCFHVSK
ncbi:hypothetical protein T09_7545 [Trichinella sp. T9]|nr:hypothetical protein T09_7545 [Trichinella sp. T9]